MMIGRGGLSGVRALLLALLGGCFNPTYNRPSCGSGSSCPSGLFCVAGFCETSPGGDATSCWQRWFDGEPALQLTMPQLQGGLCPEEHERDPWISADGKRLYFVCVNGNTNGKNDLYFTTRTSATDSFSKGAALIDLNTADDEEHPALSDDEKMLVFASKRGSTYKLFVTMRDTSGNFPSPTLQDQQMLSNVNASTSTNYYDPFLTMNGLRLYFAPLTNGGQHIEVTTRATGQNFPVSAPVPGLANAAGKDFGPMLSPDERVIVFSSFRPPGGDPDNANLWYATRQNAIDPFGTPRSIPMVNGDSSDTSPMLVANGCELYFASTRDSDGRPRIYLSRVTQ